jgi:hypothetical protein
MQKSDIESELSGLIPVTLDDISGVKLMNRMEIKYLFAAGKLTELINSLGNHYHVLEINKMRILPYSTTYFDTDDSFFYNQHVRGKFARHKIRYRRYEATDESFLEIKKKTNKGRTIKWRIENRQLSDSFDNKASSFIREYLPVTSTLIKPAIINHFTRITLAGFELKERITIDFNISFSRPDMSEEIMMPYLAIAELKKESHSDSSHFKGLIKQLNIYPNGFSKYCVGSALLNNSLKRNMIKPKLLLINKLENEYYGSDVTG